MVFLTKLVISFTIIHLIIIIIYKKNQIKVDTKIFENDRLKNDKFIKMTKINI